VAVGSSLLPTHTSQSSEPGRRAIVTAWKWLLIAIVFTLASSIGRQRRVFTEDPHGWAMAHLALMADSFKSHGIIALHGIPIQNAGVDGVYPDFYVHWPPLCAAILSLIVRVFGDSEPVIFASGSIMALAFAGSWFWFTDELFGRLRALWSTFALLTLGVFIERSHIWTVSLCYALVLLSMRIVIADWEEAICSKRAILVAAGLLSLATLTSWEALLMPPGLFVAALPLKDRRLVRYSAFLWLIAGLTVAAFLALPLVYVPELRNELVATIKYRAGLRFAVPPTLNGLADAVNYVYQPSATQFIEVLFLRIIRLIGVIGATSAVVFARRFWINRVDSLQRRQFVVFTTFAFIALAWFVAFPNHVVIHDYEYLIVAPMAALGSGELLSNVSASAHSPRRQALHILLPLILIFQLATQSLQIFMPRNISADDQKAKDVQEYSLEMGSVTPAAAVIGSPYLGMYIPYYAKRHVVRGVQDDRAVQLLFSHMKEYPDDPVYLDIPYEELGDFPCSIAAFEQAQLKYGILLNLRLNRGISLIGPGCTLAPHQRSRF
jgi:hypothetical protein